jgi:hypothetical protein
MNTDFVSDGVWKAITSAAKRSRKPARVAVAYFARGASKLLPLAPNSRLVVDASEGAVKSGQTCPADLKWLQKRGVVIYSYPDLHAKVYAFDGFAFIGSANVSSSSSSRLTEAVIRTTERHIVRSAKSFVQGLCLDELSPGRLDKLAGIYRPPRMPGGGRRPADSPRRRSHSALPRILLAQLTMKEIPYGFEEAEATGLSIAKSRQQNKRKYKVDSFWWTGVCPFREKDKVVRVTELIDGRRLIDRPSDVIYTRTKVKDGKRVTFVYIEGPDIRRISLDKLARRLGRGAKKKLQRSGLVRNHIFADELLASLS